MKVPDGWRLGKLADCIADIESGRSLNSDDKVPSTGEPAILKTSAVYGNAFRSTENKRIVDAERVLAKCSMRANTVVVNRSNSYQHVGSSGHVDHSDMNLYLPDKLWALTPSALADSRWLHAYLSLPETRRLIADRASGTSAAMKNISQAAFSSIRALIPPLPEQLKIAEILRTWDDAIERTQTLVDATREMKRSLVRRVLADSPETKNVPLDHVVRPLTAKNSLGETRVLTSSAIHGLVSQSDYFSKSVAGSDISGYYLLHRGDFAYNRSSSNGFPYGAIRRLDEHERGVISTLYLCFTPIAPELADTDYLAHSFASGVLDPQLALICHEGARSHGLLNVSRAHFFELVIPLPSVERQHFIAAVLDEADAEIALLNRNLELLRAQKRGLMQKLLTGEVRVQLNAKQMDSADV